MKVQNYKNPKAESQKPKFAKLPSTIYYLLLTLLLFTTIGHAQGMPYCCAPSWVMNVTKPNILFIQDVTGSQLWRAEWTVNSGYYDPDRSHYGYFKEGVDYYEKAGVFYPSGFQPAGSTGPFPGSVMNWACMSRIDVTRKVLTGGKGTPASQFPKNTLESQGDGSGWYCYLCTKTSGKVVKYRFDKPAETSVKIDTTTKATTWNYPYPDTIILAQRIPPGTRTLKINIPSAEWMSKGVIRQICDKDLNTNFDEDAPRIGLFFFSTSTFDLTREFWESDGPAAVSAEAYINDINNASVGGATPVGKAVLDATCYIAWVTPKYGSYTKTADAKRDPYNTWAGDSVWCRKSFVILLGDGESNSDEAVASYNPPLPPKIFPARPLYNYDGVWENYDDCSGAGDTDHPADDFAYYGHITDLRPDLPDKQSIEFYSIFSFGKGVNLFKEIGKDGGFQDKNNDNIPQVNEYDEDGDGIPDHYYDAEDGYQLEAAIMEIIYDILANISSSSGAAVVSAGTKVGGGTVQAQFYPRRKFPTGERLDWVGNCYGLWLDPFGNLREDNHLPSSHTLHLLDDYVITMQWDAGAENVMVSRYQDVNGDGKTLNFVSKVPLEDLIPIWDGGKWLWNNFNPPTDRNIWTSLTNGNTTPFTLANNNTLKPYLGTGLALAQADTIIRYVRGEDIDTTILRSRTTGGKVWKLGDIINSSPALYGTPVERYDFIYGDLSYNRYYLNKNRHQVVYVGANDGMLHAFNGGEPVALSTSPYEPLKLDPGTGLELGQELWSYIPRNLLPHLKWLKDPTYGECHVYYVDLKPYVTEAQVFKADSLDGIHHGGWGSLLIGGMRLGGTKIRCDAIDTCRSAYFAIDVSDPFNPEPMWEFTHPNLQYTVCYSTVVKVKDRWFLVMGSGPMTCGGDCSQTGKIYVLDLKTGDSLRTFTLPDPQSFVTDIFACDFGIDYTVDFIYFGDCWYDAVAKKWKGKVYRISTNNKPDPVNWTMEMRMDMGQPVTAEGSVATDEYNNLWVYFGSGRLFSDNDEIDPTKHTYVGFRDDTTHTTDPLQLYNVTNVTVDTNELVQPGNLPFDSLVASVYRKGGWYRQFEKDGERNLTTTLVLGGAVLFTTYIPAPDAICSFGGEGNLYALYYKTGTAYTQAFLGDTLGYNRVFLALGSGMPSEPALYVSADQTKVFIQIGGGMATPETGIPGMGRLGVILWKGK